jgi:N-acetyl-1-D-myo-inositol-2-amino-2-deoxy-alpha-D-glucopyranoside deacetylase
LLNSTKKYREKISHQGLELANKNENESSSATTDRRLLCVVAHPDDETFGSGSTILKYASEGASVYTACATRGDVGEIADRSDAAPETLSAVREQEYYAAGKILGVKRSILYGYRDSGMAGTADNEHPNAYINVPIEDLVAQIVDTIRELKPHIVFTFDEGGGYGHPDHMHASKAAKQAYFAAGDPAYTGSEREPWTPLRFYYHAYPRSLMSQFIAAVAAKEPDSDIAKVDPEMMGVPDEKITTTLNTETYKDKRLEAVEAHYTQYSPFDRMPSEVANMFLTTDYFIRIDPPPAANETGIFESDLFDGLDV